ncbi:MAG: hypothetical protein E6I16_10170 [Chloroflexi bacterium]|nr:MAG: hypothetical protein E6I16_10170 [Chloroflexota bacterium]
MGAARSRRRGGWWGVAFIVTLAVSAGMVSLPTSTQSGALIAGFYRAHAAVILVQQVLGVLSLVFFLAFARALGAGRRRWLLVGTVLVAITEIATNVLPAVLALSNPAPDGAYALTVVEDLADAALFASIAVFSIAATIDQVAWVQVAGLVVAALSVIRAAASPFAVTALDVLAPLAFLVLILILSVRLLIGTRSPIPTAAASL